MVDHTELMTINAAKDALKKTPQGIHHMIKTKKLRAVRIDTQWFVTKKSVREVKENG